MILLFCGARAYGRTDVVPRTFYVATRFVHIFFVPLIPMGSLLVFHGQGDPLTGIPIPLSAKSVLLGWIRGACVVFTVFPATLATAPGPGVNRVACLVIAGVAASVLVASYAVRRINRPTYERAHQLALLAGLTEPAIAQLRREYGKGDDYSAVHGFPVNPPDVSGPRG